MDLRFVGSEQLLFFNLTVLSGQSGSPVWRIENVPVLSREGPDMRQVTTFHFSLANTPGDRVPFLAYGYALTAQPLAEMPDLAVRAHVGRRNYAIDTGYGGLNIIFTPPPDRLAGGLPDGAPCSHEGFVNQEAGKDECVPAAISNSLNWMNELYGLGIPTDEITIEALKSATGWSADIPGCDDNWPGRKAQYLAERGIGVTSEDVDRFRVDLIRDAICRGCDVEIGIGNHTVAVTGIQKLANGNFTLDLTHDSEQGHPDGTITETAVYDNVFGRFHGDAWLENKAPELIVVECPFFLPTPTPSATRTPTDSPTPQPTRTRTATPPPATPTTTAPTRDRDASTTTTPQRRSHRHQRSRRRFRHRRPQARQRRIRPTPTPGSPTATPTTPTPALTP